MASRSNSLEVRESVIVAVQKHSVLYDQHHKDYRKRFETIAAWLEVSKETNLIIQDCQSMWSQLRSTFIRYYKKFNQSPGQRTEWPFFNRLMFLEDCIPPAESCAAESTTDKISEPQMYEMMVKHEDVDDKGNESGLLSSVSTFSTNGQASPTDDTEIHEINEYDDSDRGAVGDNSGANVSGSKTSKPRYKLSSRANSLPVRSSLIKAVRKRKLLYDQQHADYKSRVETELAWKDVSDDTGLDIQDCKTCWNQLRSTYQRTYRKWDRPSGRGRYPKWHFFNQMMFMEKYITTVGNSIDRISTDEQQQQDNDGHSEKQDRNRLPSNSRLNDHDDSDSGTTGDDSGAGGFGTHTFGKRKRATESKYENGFVEVKKVTTQSPSSISRMQSFEPFINRLNESNWRKFFRQTTNLLLDLLDQQESSGQL